MHNITAEQWTFEKARFIFDLPFVELIYRAQSKHREHFDPTVVQVSTLLNIKTGGCPENCAYCPQSAHYNTGLKREPLMPLEEVIAAATNAKTLGSTRFCMGAAWRGPADRDLEPVCDMIRAVKAQGLETCATLGLLTDSQALKLKDAGLDFYNHNIDTSEEYYPEIISTRTFAERLETLEHVRNAGIKTCCGGILGMGESNDDRIRMLLVLVSLPSPPESVPINKLIRIPGTPLANAAEIDPLDFVRTIALTRILMPKSYIRLSAGRENMGEELQSLCFLAGANSIFFGEKLLTAPNPQPQEDVRLFNRLGMRIQEAS
ncbi:MAG: biotin synthase BioB [Proteobacteria bacterium]|nr:biotin synthase BioB [Pseudomonadota bacterium]